MITSLRRVWPLAILSSCASTTSAVATSADASDVHLDVGMRDHVDASTATPDAPRGACPNIPPSPRIIISGQGPDLTIIRTDGAILGGLADGTRSMRVIGRVPGEVVQYTPGGVLTRDGSLYRAPITQGASLTYERVSIGCQIALHPRAPLLTFSEGPRLLSIPGLATNNPRFWGEGITFNADFSAPIRSVHGTRGMTVGVVLEDGRVFVMHRYSVDAPYVSEGGDDAGVVAPAELPLPGAVRRLIGISLSGGSAIMEDGGVMEWGHLGTLLLRSTGVEGSPPTRVPGLNDIEDLSFGSRHACALTRRGTVFCWGNSSRGQLGGGVDDLGNVAAYHPPGEELALPPVRSIGLGGEISCAVTRSDEIYCWGNFRVGRFGQPDYAPYQPTPVRMTVPD